MGGYGTGIPAVVLPLPPLPGLNDTVKIALLKAIENRLMEIPEVATVKRWEDIPTDLSTLTLPVLFFWEEDELEPYNRLTKGNLDFWLQVFFALEAEDPASFTAFSETADIVAGQISNLFAAPGSLRESGLLRAEPDRVVKARYNSDYGVLFMNYQISYLHAAGDAFSI